MDDRNRPREDDRAAQPSKDERREPGKAPEQELPGKERPPVQAPPLRSGERPPRVNKRSSERNREG